MTGKIASFVAARPRIVFTAALLVLLLTVGAAGEVAAHNPAGHAVPACEQGADAVAHNNPNCHS